MGRTFCLLCQH